MLPASCNNAIEDPLQMGSWASPQSNQNPTDILTTLLLCVYIPGNYHPVAANHIIQFSSVLQRICTLDHYLSVPYKVWINAFSTFGEHPPVNWPAIVDSIIHIGPIRKQLSSHLQSVTATWVDGRHKASTVDPALIGVCNNFFNDERKSFWLHGVSN